VGNEWDKERYVHGIEAVAVEALRVRLPVGLLGLRGKHILGIGDSN